MTPQEKNRKLALSDEILLSIEKPARYIGGEINMVKKDPSKVDIRFCMCFPDVYEIGMSHLGIQILYDMFNQREDVYCERVYSPWVDLDSIMREKKIPLFALESQQPVKDFDFLGITLQYEMCYTNILQILDLSGIPLKAKDRTKEHPFVIGGGPCAYNPEPIADFFDIFYIGEGETVYDELLDTYKEWKKSDATRVDFLKRATQIEGLYIPQFYEVSYQEDGTIQKFIPVVKEAPEKILKQVERDMSETYYPQKPLVPYIKVTQDRVVLEIQRGCIRGCRFCQAGMLYRPIRPRNIEFLKQRAEAMLQATGHDEISLSSLSSSDYRELPELVYWLIENFQEKGVNISLPSLRIDAFALDVMSKIQDIRKSSLTFAPEAGSQRMRNVINKGLTEEVILKGAKDAFLSGWNRVKLYFMLGLPGETKEDIAQIAVLSDKIAREYYEVPKEQRNGKVAIVTSTSIFVPKPFTPFQWSPMVSKEEAREKRFFLLDEIKAKRNAKSIKYNCHDADVSELEGIFARGDRKLCDVILQAYESGCIYDAWSEYFRYDKWVQAFSDNQVEMDFYIKRERCEDEIFPWDFIDIGVSKEFLLREYHQAKKEQVTPNCRAKCAGCGAAKFGCGVCTEAREGAKFSIAHEKTMRKENYGRTYYETVCAKEAGMIRRIKARLKFSKTGSMRFIGHLDVMRYFQKAFRRAGIAVSYSQGFSPHQLMSFASPLGIGLSSDAEYLDVVLENEAQAENFLVRINEAMNDEITVKDFTILTEEAKTSMAVLAACDYLITVKPDKESFLTDTVKRTKALKRFMARESVEIVKKTKRSEKLVDIRENIYCLTDRQEILEEFTGISYGELSLDTTEYIPVLYCQLTAGSVVNIKPELVLEALCRQEGEEYNWLSYQIHRLEMYGDVTAKKGEVHTLHGEVPCKLIPLSDFGKREGVQ